MVPLARRNLLADRCRLGVSIGGVAFAVLLVLVVLGLYRGWSDVGRLYSALPGDVWVSERGTLDPYHSSSFLPEAAVGRLARLPGVRAAVPVFVRHVAFRTAGTELDTLLLALEPPPGRATVEDREHFPPRGRITIDRVLADAAGVGVGGSISVLGRRLVVDDIHTGGTRIFQAAFVNAADARTLIAQPGKVSFVAVVAQPGVDVGVLRAAAERVVGGSETHTNAEFAASFGERVSAGFLAVVGVLVAIGALVGGAVVALTTYTATVERSQEYGVLKAIGASGGFLARVVVAQSVLVGLAGALLGVAAAWLAIRSIPERVPEFVATLRWLDAAVVLAGALAVSVVAATVPIRRLERIDPAEVFRA